ncbi:WD domain-containing protein, G-beta repeat-containing protein [Nonomuraea wenchangensis]|uniref:WD domain-containing protein, G-beta repeat-containing protein n=1 Tax=Nonomuraea wenchangensis TaxID=568860 RepID=A0A1I0L5C6_9ACTN|nr:WD domain-containing protein, G-beta repeat-containing protein [Nonomuraea wenchangensis]
MGRCSDGTPVAVSGDIPPGPDEDGGTPPSWIRIWNLDTGKPIGASIEVPSRGGVEVVVGRRGDGSPVIVSGDDDGNLLMWDLDTGERVGEPLGGHTRPISALATGRRSDGTFVVVSGGMDKTIRIWSLRRAA